MINGVTKLVMTKADVLDSFAELNVCNAYKINGEESFEVPFQITRVKLEPVYKAFKGWNKDTTSMKNTAQLPVNMTDYINFINQYVGAPVKYVSNGPGREQIICL
jgi:adenylosuccinate synthase